MEKSKSSKSCENYGSPTRLCYLKAIKLGMPDYMECSECIESHYPFKKKRTPLM